MISNSLLLAASFAPKSLEIPNAWVGHLPFAAWLIQEISPKIFVELGTHTGNSYFTFCQSVVDAGISAKCYAVDTWQGDEHAGQYGNEVFAKVDSHNQEHYAGHSRLLRMTFDDAVDYFADESIDLLHIDGLHTYEAVRHDFETWLPKLARGAVVIFHDTNVRERNFGVWKLWAELQAIYPNNIEFVHSHGLGILQLNVAPNDTKLEWLHPDSSTKQLIINFFTSLGSRQLELFGLTQAVAERDRQIVERDKQIVERDKQIVERDKQIVERDKQIEYLQHQLNQILRSRSWRLMMSLRMTVKLLGTIIFGVVRRGKSLMHVATRYRRRRDELNKEIETIRNSGLFDEDFYRSIYADVQPPPQDVIRHYCENGWREGRNPSLDFDTKFYLATNSDIQNAGINPFWHYVVAGLSESRHASPQMGTMMRYDDDILFGAVDTDIKLLAFYSSPDWVALRGGRPQFKGHSPSPLPHEYLGCYDLTDWRIFKNQAELAKRHGLYGFCFDLSVDDIGATFPHPNEIFLAHNDIDFRFCVQVELPSEEVLVPLVAAIAHNVSDRRYVRIADRPVVIFTIPKEGTHNLSSVNQLRQRLADAGVDQPFLIGRWATEAEGTKDTFPADGIDAMLDLPSIPVPGETGGFLPLDRNGIDVVPYCIVASQGIARVQKTNGFSCPIYHVVTLGRDNTTKKPERPLVYTRFHLQDYRRWLDAAIAGSRAAHPEDCRFVFLNAWNAWNEGLVIEPDRRVGFAHLNETSRALLNISSGELMPKVSVVVPNYNHELFLRRRLDSIYGQTYTNIEVILMDDCSSDNSRLLLDEYAVAYPNITLTLYNDVNSGGPFRQWAKGIKAATGDLVWIAESDDYCDERFLETLVRCFDDEAVLLAYAKTIFVGRNEVPIVDEFKHYVSDLQCAAKWDAPYVETAHNEVRSALGIKNTIPNASGVVFRRPIDMPLLDDESWLSMTVAGDWVFYLHVIRGGKIAYITETSNFFRRYPGSTAEVTYRTDRLYREVGQASLVVASLYDVSLETLDCCRRTWKSHYASLLGQNGDEFERWFDFASILRARETRLPNVMISTMGFYAGGAEILPIRLANEFKRLGLSVMLFSAGVHQREDGVRRMLRNDVPVIETPSVEYMKAIIHEFGVECLNTHQWHVQKYPLQIPDVFKELRAHVASMHGMIEHGNTSDVTAEELRMADRNVTTWVYTAQKNLIPFADAGLYAEGSPRFVKIPNGMQPPRIVPILRAEIEIPEDAFTLCCISRAIPDKGWAETIQVVDRARALSGQDIRLILVGNGLVYDEYCEVGVPDFVYLAGFSDNAVGYYAAADMGIMLTKFKSESFPLTIVDCLFAGKPYIASDVGDIRSMLTVLGGVAGEVIDLENWEIPIERVAHVVASFATDKKKYTNAQILAQNIAKRYQIDVVASQYVRLFERARIYKK